MNIVPIAPITTFDVVPPWVVPGGGNGGIVPPWMRDRIIIQPMPVPVDGDQFVILPVHAGDN